MVASSLSTSDFPDEGEDKVELEARVPKRGLSAFWGETGIGVDLVDSRRIDSFRRANLGRGRDGSGGVAAKLVFDSGVGSLACLGIQSGN